MSNLYARRANLRRKLGGISPIVRGSVVELGRVCGRPNCHCKKGEKHMSRYLSTSVHGKTSIFYLTKHAEGKARKWVANYKEASLTMEKLSETNIQILKNNIKDNPRGKQG